MYDNSLGCVQTKRDEIDPHAGSDIREFLRQQLSGKLKSRLLTFERGYLQYREVKCRRRRREYEV